MKEEDIRIVFDPSQVKIGEEYNVEFALTTKEKSYFPFLDNIDDLHFTLSVEGTSEVMHLPISCAGIVHLFDAHDGEKCDVELEDSVDVIIDTSHDENSDILPDEDGLYDLRGSILALLFNTIPQNYSEVELTRVEGNGYILMSEEEYEKERAKQNNPFAGLDDSSFEE